MAPKKKRDCPNPLFLKWLEEWKADAEKKGVNAKFTYAKAITSIKKYPLPLRSGKEAKILENIGDGIANRLDKALAEFIENGGDLSNPFGDIAQNDDTPDLPSFSPEKKKPRKRKAPGELYLDISNQAPVAGVDFSPNAKFAKSRDYLPAYRSGAYALIITLYQECQKPDYPGYLNKGDLQEKAQHLADKSFTIPDAGSHYTAWSSMGTLVKKGYVLKTSSPAKYAITDFGCALANKLLTAQNAEHNMIDSPLPRLPMDNNNPRQNIGNVTRKTSHTGRETLPRAGAGLLSELQDQINQLNPAVGSASLQKNNNNPRPKTVSVPKKTANSGREALPLAGAGLLSEFQDKINHVSTTVASASRTTFKKGATSTNMRGSSSLTQTVSALSSNVRRSSATSEEHPFTIPVNNVSTPVSKISQSEGQRLGGGHGTPNLLHVNSRYAKLQEEISAKARKKSESSSTQTRTLKGDNMVPSTANSFNISAPVNLDKWEDTASASSDSYFQYVTDANTLTLMKDKAVVTIDDTIGLGFLVKTNKNSLERSGKLYKLDDSSRPCETGFIYVYLADKDAPDQLPYPSSSKVCSVIDVEVAELNDGKRNSNDVKKFKENMTKDDDLKVTNIHREVMNKSSISIPLASGLSSKGSLSTGNSVSKASDCNVRKVDSCSSRQLKDLSDADLKPMFTLQPGLFDVILLVDMIETGGYGGGKGKKKEVSDKLTKSGIPMDIRKLQVGDFMWVAKEKFGLQRELVLDFIVERKRMDDLAGSITDGRFREQKFRLKSSGLKHCVYLIEKYGSMQHLSIPESTLRQAITNTQVVDKLFVKETNDVIDSVEYLALMTAELKSIYADKILHALPAETVKLLKESASFDDVISNDKQYLMTFEEFSSISVKNKVLTVKQVFATHLMQLNGVSTDRALAIVEKYPTPSSLMTSYRTLHSIYDKENMLTNIEFGRAKRKVGAPISKQIYYLYCTKP